MKISNLKKIMIASLSAMVFSGCVSSGLIEDTEYLRTKVGAGIGSITGGIIAYKKSKGKKGSRRRRDAIVGSIGGAILGGGAGYALDMQANKVAKALGTGVDNDPLAKIDPNKKLIVSKTNNFVKILFRTPEMFQSGSASLNDETKKNISKVATLLKQYPKTIVVVGGHTDNTGSAFTNEKLSSQRAKSVANILRLNGSTNQKQVVGCSFENPVASNDTAENRALNRRIEIFLYNDINKISSPCNN